jgi:hypothetical protein
MVSAAAGMADETMELMSANLRKWEKRANLQRRDRDESILARAR